jgi:hypothetical protein
MGVTMPDMQAHNAFVQFMVDYTAFLGRMRADESEKLASLAGRQLARIEQSIAKSQANAKQLENYERKRLQLQAQAGYEGLAFRQLIDVAPTEEQERLWQVFTHFEGNVAEIRFYNDKSMAAARDAMIDVNPAAALMAQPGAGARNPYERMRKLHGEQGSLLLEQKA